MIKEELKKIIETAVKKSGFNLPEILIEKSKEINHGDYSTSLALVLSKQFKKNSMEIADKIISQIGKNKLFKKIEAVSPGFINFYLSEEFFINNLKEILKGKENFGKNQNLKDQKVIVEYTDPNILKEFHIGHLMSNSIGESLSRIFEFNGAKIKKICYQSDVGLGIAKAIWGKIEKPDLSWQDSYVFGTKSYDENESFKKEIIELNKKIFERSDKNVNKIYDEGKKWSLDHFNGLYKKLGTKFDYFIFESEISDFGKKIVGNGLKKGIFEKGEKGAIIFKGEQYGLHTRVFINSEGLPTYEAKELALAKEKYKKYKYDQSVVVTGNEINEYFKVLLSAMLQIFPELAEKTKHIGHGMMRLPEGKMSSRTGKVITAEFLIGEVEKLVAEKIKDRDLSNKEKEEITEKVAIGALKYSILKQSIGSDIIYNFEKSISFEGDSGPYLQYSYARAQSILKKAKVEKIKSSLKNIPNEISQLEKDMSYFPEIIEKASKEYEPHYIVLYLIEIARDFNNYYANNKIIDSTDEFSPYKVALTQAFSIIMKNGLWLLGINSLEKM
ncbi:MAG: arginine--tRNA ligase [Patescibacteria group bacterium]